jgi:hypothetical protein
MKKVRGGIRRGGMSEDGWPVVVCESADVLVGSCGDVSQLDSVGAGPPAAIGVVDGGEVGVRRLRKKKAIIIKSNDNDNDKECSETKTCHHCERWRDHDARDGHGTGRSRYRH